MGLLRKEVPIDVRHEWRIYGDSFKFRTNEPLGCTLRCLHCHVFSYDVEDFKLLAYKRCPIKSKKKFET